MDSARWESIKRLFHEALERPSCERDRFVREAASGDAELGDEVVALLTAHTRADEAFREIAGSSGGLLLQSGTRLGPYELNHLIGAGGMGEVYHARDTRLDRTVAIKVLPLRFARAAALRERLQREARAISSLSHPHICALYDIGEQDGVDFLVMEYLEGETLADRLVKGPLALPDALQYATEIGRAFTEAHRRGIIHRDFKPANVMLTAAGAKLLDFGIAKLHPVWVPDETRTRSAEALTGEGVIVG